MQNCSRANLLWFHPEGSIVYFTVCAPLDWPVSVTAPKLTFCDAPEGKASPACNPVAYADRGSKGTPLAHFFPPFLWASKEMGRGVGRGAPQIGGAREGDLSGHPYPFIFLFWVRPRI